MDDEERAEMEIDMILEANAGDQDIEEVEENLEVEPKEALTFIKNVSNRVSSKN